MIKIFIIAEHLMFAYGLAELLRKTSGFTVVGREADIRQALPKIKINRPHIVIIYDSYSADGTSPVNQSEELAATARAILEANPQTKVIGLNVHNNHFQVYQSMQQIAEPVRRVATDVVDLFSEITARG